MSSKALRSIPFSDLQDDDVKFALAFFRGLKSDSPQVSFDSYGYARFMKALATLIVSVDNLEKYSSAGLDYLVDSASFRIPEAVVSGEAQHMIKAYLQNHRLDTKQFDMGLLPFIDAVLVVTLNLLPLERGLRDKLHVDVVEYALTLL